MALCTAFRAQTLCRSRAGRGQVEGRSRAGRGQVFCFPSSFLFRFFPKLAYPPCPCRCWGCVSLVSYFILSYMLQPSAPIEPIFVCR